MTSSLFTHRVFNTQLGAAPDAPTTEPVAVQAPVELAGFTAAEKAGVGFTSQRARNQLIDVLREAGIANEQVLSVMAEVPRHLFVDAALSQHAYQNRTLPIGQGQTISQPWVVARMTELLLAPKKPRKVLEVGTGCGYQTAVLAGLVATVYSVERIAELQARALNSLGRLGVTNVTFSLSDGNWGWAEPSPYDAIIVTAAPREVPDSLLDQLAVGGRLVIPAGPNGQQRLQVFDRVTEHDFEHQYLDEVAFVPLRSGVQS